ncbi:MAG: M24 family metallopeptidase [Epulopiscium sp.]|nr:M24 family metallopeptidase [Candidatus Epulonipiscium sp.]
MVFDILKEVKEKEERIYKFLDQNGYDGMIIGRQDNFSWITGGGNSRVIWSTELGFSYLFITKEKKFCISQVMDGPRIMDEVLSPLGYDYIPLRWYEQNKEEKLEELIKGKKVISDFPLPGAIYNLHAIYHLHYPLMDSEIEKYRILGKEVDEILTSTALEIEPGMTEMEVEGMLMGKFGQKGIIPDVILIGADERPVKYRHPVPTERKIDHYVFISPSIKKWGLHANISRLISFGKPSSEIAHKYEAACTIEAHVLSMCKEGTYFKDILEAEKKLYKELGYEEEWRNHFQGGITGYMVANASLCLDQSAKLQNYQSYEWFITIAGTKSAELALNINNQIELMSLAGYWKTKSYTANNHTYELPIIMER